MVAKLSNILIRAWLQSINLPSNNILDLFLPFAFSFCAAFVLEVYLPRNVTHRYGSVTVSPFSVEEVSGLHPGRVILKTLKIVPTASLFGAEHVRVRVGAVRIFRAWIEKSIGLVALGCESIKISLRGSRPRSWTSLTWSIEYLEMLCLFCFYHSLYIGKELARKCIKFFHFKKGFFIAFENPLFLKW
jgi:hypothetical protein